MEPGTPLPEPTQSQQLIFTLQFQIILIAIAVISSAISLFFPVIYYVRRRCQEHPSSLIAIISLLEALSNFNIILIAVNIYQFEQDVRIAEIFNFLVFFGAGKPSDTQFCDINFTIYILLELLSISYNISFSADLLITLKKPFFSGKKRMKYYNMFALVMIACSLPMSMLQAEDICDKQFHQRSIYKIPLAFLISIFIFYAISFVIIFMSFRNVQRSNIRQKYIRMHRIILYTLIVLWAFPIVANVMIILGDQSSAVFDVFNKASFISLLVSGGIINVVRYFNDPYVWQEVKSTVMNPNGRNKKRSIERQDSQDEQSKISDQQADIWNLPLAHAVATYHHQSVISNIIQIVLQTCANTPEQLMLGKSSFMNTQKNYSSQSRIYNMSQIKSILKNGSKQEIRRLTKLSKKLEMLCLQKSSKYKQKTIYKASDFHVQQSMKLPSNIQGTIQSRITNKTKLLTSLTKQDRAIDIRVQSYADPVFIALRLIDNLTSQQLTKTLNLASNADSIKRARQSLGASGSFFFFSSDSKLVIKTISQSECNIFLKILPDYYEHIVKNPHSLLSRAYGLFSVEIAGISKIYFIMMENTLREFDQNRIIYKRYDLKGSTIKRQVKNLRADVFKDINYLKSEDAFLLMTQPRRQKLLAQINSDITLLRKQNIMDYSLLLAVGPYKKVKRSNHQIIEQKDLQQSNLNEWRCFDDNSNITGKIYSLSLIDYLQEFDMNKYMELKLKQVFKGGGDISSVDTDSYYQRFLKFVGRIVVVVNT